MNNFRKIVHLDMDAFYASVEVLDAPELAGKPVIVGGDSKRGVVSAASYAARKFGVHSAMPIHTAIKLCPAGVFLKPRMSRYVEVSKLIMSIFHEFTPLVEPLSLDEAFLDVTGSEKLFGPARDIAEKIRKKVKDGLGLTVSAGVASSKLVAKIASDINKPDGLTVVEPGTDRAFLAPLPISKLWGVGKVTHKQLKLLGVCTIGDLAKISEDILVRKFGKLGTHLFYASKAIDAREVEPAREIQSIGHEETFSHDVLSLQEIQKELLSLALKVGRRLRDHEVKARTIIVKLKYYDFEMITRSKTLHKATDSGQTLYRQGCLLLKETMAGKKPARLVGITAANLLDKNLPVQASLFEPEIQNEAEDRLNKALDKITKKFGCDILRPGTLVD